MEIITLGCCCKKSQQNHLNAIEAAKNCGVEEPTNTGDYNEFMKYGVMSTPAIVIDGKAVATGKMSSVKEIEGYIKARL
jgi:predicted thioredoxin/glutaredoxin